MAQLPQKPTMADYQTYVDTICKERGWDTRNALEKMLFLTEEVGEVAKAVRKELGYDGKKPENIEHLSEELVDVFNYIIDLANMFDVDLEQAFRAKWEKNATRTWDSTQYKQA